MHPTARLLLEAVAIIGTVGSLFFYALSAVGLMSFLKLKRAPPSQLPPVSILKPLKGIDPENWESFCSHCEQDYPEFELIFGVSDPNDPAIELVRKLQAQYPNRRIELIDCRKILGANVKVSNLAQMLPAARHDILLVSDSDIRVPRDYLRRVVPPLAGEGARATQGHATQVGLVTCLYRGIAAKALGSRLEALGISMDFVPGVLSARLLEGGIRFAFGSTMVFRKADLKAIGGFEVLLDYLADDYELGRRISARGKRVELSDVTVETFLPAYSFRQFVDHQLRWARTIRHARPWGYLGTGLTFGLPWSIAMLLASRGAPWAWALALTSLAARVGVGLATSLAVLDDRQALRNVFLLPLRDLIAPLVWATSFAGHRIYWRGEVFTLKDGRLARVSQENAGV